MDEYNCCGRWPRSQINIYKKIVTITTLQRTLRKREVTLSRINIYIVYIIVSCHTIRIIPNAWEIVHR